MSKVIDILDFIWQFPLIYLILACLKGLEKMATLTVKSPASSPLANWVEQSKFSSENSLKVNDENLMEVASQSLRQSQTQSDGVKKDNSVLISTTKLRKRPAKLLVPEYCPVSEFGNENGKKKSVEKKEVEIEGKDFYLVSRQGKRSVMEDNYALMVDILGNPKQAFYAVIDGHGGQAAAEHVANNLGKNIMENIKEKVCLEETIREGYLKTDRDFLDKGIGSGACAASVLLKDGVLYVANVGDCKIVLSRNGIAQPLTIDHRLSSEDERLRIENSGGFVSCRNGVWRVQGSLAVSRAIGDIHLKQWVIPEPDVNRVQLTSDCDFLIIASDGLWDKVNEQEAVDVVVRENKSLASCKKLVDISCSRGSIDDITLMLINLQN